MRKIIWPLLLCLVVMPLRAATFTVDSNCDVHSFETSWNNTNHTWQGVCDGVEISGDYICSSMGGVAGDVSIDAPSIDTSDNRGSINHNCWCKMTSPYVGYYWVFTGYSTFDDSLYSYAEDHCHGGSSYIFSSCSWRCARLWNQSTSGYNMEYTHYGYYTDENLIKVKRGLFADGPLEIPCEIGISKLMVSTGDSFQLYAEQYTEHALVVQYKDQRCYLKLEEGKGGLNIMANDTIYHVVE